MSEFIDVGGGYGSQATEIYLKRVLAGNIESVRARLSAALERLGYDVIEEEPTLIGRRGARSWGTWYGSADILDYAMTLTIRFKPVGPYATRATFDYTVNHPWLSRGEKEVLTREVDALTALATVRAVDKVCAACGTETTDDSRFCRRCGAPLSSEQAELDVLRMTAETRAGHTSVVTSAAMLMITNIMTILAFILMGAGVARPKGLWTLAIIGSIIGFLNLLVTFCAWSRLNGALNFKRERQQVVPVGSSVPALPVGEPAALPPRRAVSVTEGTTELLGAPQREPEAIRIKRGREDTNSIN